MKKIIVIVFTLCMSVDVHAASMCMVPMVGTTSSVGTGSAAGNRGTWASGNNVIGEAHCSAVSVIGPTTTSEDFEKSGNNCWCRVRRVAAPNGFFAWHEGAWVFNLWCNCSQHCASFCIDNFRSNIGFRRTLLASPYHEI